MKVRNSTLSTYLRSLLFLSQSLSLIVCSSLPASAEPLTERPSLLSEFTGKDSLLQKSGITIDQMLTQFYGGVTSGGRNQGGHYSGRWDFVANVDGQKAGLWEGLFLKMRVGANWHPIERFGAGSILNPYFAGSLSKSDEPSIGITDLSVLQMFSPRFGFTAGKFDLVDGDVNAFAHGRGLTQFQNLTFTLNPVSAYIPLSTLGAGFLALYEDSSPLASLLVLDTNNVPTETGLDQLFNSGAVLVSEVQLPTRIASLPGRHRLGFSYTSADQISLRQDPRYVLEQRQLQTEANSWTVTYNAEQFLVTSAESEKQGWGFFTRAAISDPDKNIFHYMLSAGLGGTGVIPSRPNDRFGIGVFHLEVSDLFIEPRVGIGDEQGIEAFYNMAVLPWLGVTADVQRVNGTLQSADSAWIVSGRLNVAL